MGETVDFKEVFRLLKRRTAIILIIAFGAAIISGIFSYFFIKPTYQSSTQLLINRAPSAEQTVDMNQIQADLKLVKSYHVMITSPIILDKVIQDLNLPISYEKLRKQVFVSNESESQIIEIVVEDNNISNAVLKANTIASVFQKEIVGLMNVDNVRILTKASENSIVSQKPDAIMNVLIAFVAGLVAGAGVVFFIEYLDRTIKSEKSAEKLLDLPVLAQISEIDSNREIYKSLYKKQKNIIKGSKQKVGGEKTIGS